MSARDVTGKQAAKFLQRVESGEFFGGSSFTGSLKQPLKRRGGFVGNFLRQFL